MSDTKGMTFATAADLIRHQIVKPLPWPKFDLIEKAIRTRRGTYKIENSRDSVSVTVYVMGQTGFGSSDELNQAATVALLDALSKAMPELKIFDDQREVDPDTGEFHENDGQSLAAAIEDLAAKDISVSVNFDPSVPRERTKAQIAKEFTAKGDGSADVIYDPDIGEYRTKEGDIYASGSVEDAVGAVAL